MLPRHIAGAFFFIVHFQSPSSFVIQHWYDMMTQFKNSEVVWQQVAEETGIHIKTSDLVDLTALMNESTGRKMFPSPVMALHNDITTPSQNFED